MTRAASGYAPFQPFDGPLRRLWGASMAADALRRSLPGAAARLGIPTIADRAFWSAADAPTTAALAADAAAEAGAPWPQPLLSQFASFFRDGNRTRYEDRVRERAFRLTRAVLMAAITDETGWLDEAADGILLACEQSGWSWAAHDDVFSAHGEVVPRDASPYLDLGAGELAAQLAWADHVLGPALDTRAPGLRARIRAEVARRVFAPFLERRDWHWLGLDGDVHNWNPWIHGNVIAAAVLLGAADEQEQAELVARALDGLDRYVATLPADGATDEGFAYWWNGACRAIEALELVRRATGGVLDAAAVPSLAATASFPHRMHLGGARYLNVADGPGLARGGEPWHVPFAWGRRVGDADAARHARAQRAPGAPVAEVAGGLGRLLHALADGDWAAAPAAGAEAAGPPLVGRSWLPSIEVLLVRERPGTADGLALAVKGGHNGEHHNHLDVGSVVVAAGGVPVVVDAGKTTYDAQTFGPRRYGIRAMQTAWHSAPAPLGLEQGVGAGFRAELVEVDETGAEFELAGAYPLRAGDSWRRAARLDRERGAVTVADAWSLGGASAPAVVHYLLRADPERVGETALRVTAPENGRSVLLEWDRPEASAALEDWALDDPELAAVWGERLTRLTLALDEPVGRLTVTLRSEG